MKARISARSPLAHATSSSARQAVAAVACNHSGCSRTPGGDLAVEQPKGVQFLADRVIRVMALRTRDGLVEIAGHGRCGTPVSSSSVDLRGISTNIAIAAPRLGSRTCRFPFCTALQCHGDTAGCPLHRGSRASRSRSAVPPVRHRGILELSHVRLPGLRGRSATAELERRWRGRRFLSGPHLLLRMQ